MTVASALLDLKITLALSFALSVIAAFSLLTLRLSRGDVAVLSVQPRRLRVFKLERAVLTLNLKRAGRRMGWLSLRVDTIRMPGGVEANFKAVSQTAVEVTVIPRYAGRHRGLGAKYELNDPLGIFAEFGEAEFEDFTIDVLPHALLAPAQRVIIPAVTMGEKPAGRRGAAQELYAIDEYHPFAETKEILWKRAAARTPDERLLVRVREANIPRSLKIGLIEAVERGSGRPAWMDSATEAVAAIGSILLRAGTEVEVLRPSSGGVARLRASNLGELGDLVVEMWTSIDASHLPEVTTEADFLVTGLEELERRAVSEAARKKPSLLILEGSETSHRRMAERVIVYSGAESVVRVVSEVLAR